MWKEMNTREQGDIGVASAISWFTENGFKVSFPLSESLDYDLIVDNGEEIYRVQVKTSRFKRAAESYIVSLRTSGGNMSGKGKRTFFTERKVDLLFILCEDGSKYLIPKGDIPNKSSMQVGGPRKLREEYRVGFLTADCKSVG